MAGLEITDSSLRYLLLDKSGQTVKQAAVALPAGTVAEGQVVNSEQLLAALRQLPRSAVILSFSPAHVYTQIFNLPYLEGEKLTEAAFLNLKMISPLPRDTAYADWQVLGTSSGGGLEVLGAFVNNKIVEELLGPLRQAGLLAVAAEFTSLSLIRALGHLEGVNAAQPFLLLAVGSDGLNLSLSRRGQLYFNYFVSWQEIQEKAGGGQVSFNDFQQVIIAELRRLLNFASTKWGETIKRLLLASSQPPQAISAVIKKEFNLTIEELPSPDWLAVTGAALRGLTPRAQDTFISLTSVGTEEEYQRTRLWRFIRLWRNVALAALAIILLIYLAADLVLVRINRGLLRQLSQAGAITNLQEIESLQTQAREFNALVDKAVAAKEKDGNWSEILRKLQLLAGSELRLTQIRFEPGSGVLALTGTAGNERAAINFKNNLAKETAFTDLSFPLSAITVGPDGRASFTATFKIKK